jgi:hypothetical protein
LKSHDEVGSRKDGPGPSAQLNPSQLHEEIKNSPNADRMAMIGKRAERYDSFIQHPWVNF